MGQPNQKNVRVTRTSDQRSPEGIRKLSRALIALAQAQLEAEAQAEVEARTAQRRPKPNRMKDANRQGNHETGDAA